MRRLRPPCWKLLSGFVVAAVGLVALGRCITPATPAAGRPVVASTPAPEPVPVERPIVAVFTFQDHNSGLDALELEAIADYFGALLHQSRRFRLVPKTEVKTTLSRLKGESYELCYDESCQLEVGKELAAQLTVSGTISRVGQICIVTATMFDLVKAVSSAAGTARGGCEDEALMTLVESTFSNMLGETEGGAATGSPSIEALRATLDSVPSYDRTEILLDFLRTNPGAVNAEQLNEILELIPSYDRADIVRKANSEGLLR